MTGWKKLAPTPVGADVDADVMRHQIALQILEDRMKVGSVTCRAPQTTTPSARASTTPPTSTRPGHRSRSGRPRARSRCCNARGASAVRDRGQDDHYHWYTRGDGKVLHLLLHDGVYNGRSAGWHPFKDADLEAFLLDSRWESILTTGATRHGKG